MLIPAPKREHHFPQEFQKRERKPLEETRVETHYDVSRFAIADQVIERSDRAIREALETQLAYARDAVATENQEGDDEFAPALQLRSAPEPRRVVAEWKNDDGTVSRSYSTGEVLTRAADGSLTNEAGVQIRAAGAAEVRVFTGSDANVLRGER